MVDQASEFFNRPFKKSLKENHREMYSKYLYMYSKDLLGH